jgi:hypothetical protein
MYTTSSSQQPPPQMLDAFHVSDQTGEICHMAGFPVVSPFTDSNFFPARTFAKGFVTYNDLDDSQPKELVFYTVDPNTAKLTVSQRVDVSALNGDVQAYTRDLKFFYTMSNDLPPGSNCDDSTQALHSYERTEYGFKELGVIPMGKAIGCTTTNDPRIVALAPNESWMLIDHFRGGPTGDSDGDDYAVFTIDPMTHEAVQGPNFTFTLGQDFRWAVFSPRPDSRTMIEFEGANDDIPQRLHSWQINEYGQVTEAPGSPIDLDIVQQTNFFMAAGPSHYIAFLGGMLSEWSAEPDGSLTKVGEIPDNTEDDANHGEFPQSTSSGRVFVLTKSNYPNPTDVVTFMHDHPPQVTKTQFEYLIPDGDVILFRPR